MKGFLLLLLDFIQVFFFICLCPLEKCNYSVFVNLASFYFSPLFIIYIYIPSNSKTLLI